MFVFIFALTSWFQGGSIQVEDLGFRMTFPETWTVKEDAAPLVGFAERPPRTAILMVTTHPFVTGQENDNLTRYLDGMRQNFTRHELIKSEMVRLNEKLEARMVALKGWKNDLELRHLTYLLDGFGESVLITFATEDSRYEELEAEFKQIAAGLVFSGPENFTQTCAFLDQVGKAEVDYEALQRLLDQGADINGTGDKRATALVEAILSRRGPLVKWLLAHGADPDDPTNNMSLVSMAASPSIRELLRQHAGKGSEPVKPVEKKPGALEIEWVSAEVELFAGIKDGRAEYVKEALEKGADLTAIEPNYQLAALPLARKIVAEFEELGLDGSRYQAIVDLLDEAVQKPDE